MVILCIVERPNNVTALFSTTASWHIDCTTYVRGFNELSSEMAAKRFYLVVSLYRLSYFSSKLFIAEATKARQKKMAASSFKTYGGLTKTRSESQLNQGLHFVAADIPLDEPKPTDTTLGKEVVKSKEDEVAIAAGPGPRTRRRASSMFEEGLEKFFGKSEATRHQTRREVTVNDFDLISSQSTE